MKKILIPLLSLSLISCSDEKIQDTTGLARETRIEIAPEVEIVIIDSCEYLKCYTYYTHYVYTYKGNCKFCKARK